MSVRFQTFSSSVRPHRIAVLMDMADPEWQHSCLAVVEFFTQLWGGRHSIIIPTDGTRIDEVFWALLSAHDPDLVLPYHKTGEDLRRNQPAKFEEILAREVEKQSRHGATGELVRKDIFDALLRMRLDQFDIGDALSKEILIRVAPFSFDDHLRHGSVIAGHAPSYPLVPVANVLDQVEHPKTVVELRNDSTIPNLWLASAMGWSNSEHVSALNAKGVPATPVITSQSNETDLIRWGIQPWRDFGGNTSFDVSQVGLGQGRSVRARTYELPTVLVVGDTIQDFCVYYALLCLHGRAVWIPSWFLENRDGIHLRLMSAVSKAEDLGRWEHADATGFLSTSLPPSDLEKISKSLSNVYPHKSLSVFRLSAQWIATLVKDPLRTYAKGSIGKLGTYQLVNDELPGPFESPRPANFRALDPQEHRWIVEVAFHKHRVPRHPSLGAPMASSPNLGEDSVRSSTDGLVYGCPGAFVMGRDPDFNLVRPTIRVPGAHEIFERALRYCGYEHEVSDKGRYETETIEKLGGIEGAGSALRDPEVRALLEKVS